MVKMKAFFMLVLVVVLGFLATSDAFAAIYKYTDKDGMITLADDLQSIPEQYRATAKIVSGEVEEKKKPSLQTQTPAQSEVKQVAPEPSLAQEKGPIDGIKESSFFSNRILISVIVVVSALFLFVILGMFDEDHKKTIKIIRVVILWGLSIYMLYAHAMDVVHLFSQARGKIEAVQEESAEKGRKTGRKIKELNAVMEQLGKPDGSAEADPEKKDPP
jgi:hypothetical protein